MINAVNEVTRERAQSFLQSDHIRQIVAAYESFDDIEDFSKAVSLDEVTSQDFNLSIPLYVRADGSTDDDDQDKNDLSNSVSDWKHASKGFRDSVKLMLGAFEENAIG